MNKDFAAIACSSLLVSLLFVAVYAANVPGRAAARSALEPNSGRSAPELFKSYCAECHGKDGRAKTLKSKLRYHARDLTDRKWQQDVTDERIFNSIVHGKNKMPAFAKKLSDDEVDTLVQYVRAFKSAN